MSSALLLVASCHRTAVDLSEWEASCEAYCERLFGCFDPLPAPWFVTDPPSSVEACNDQCESNPPSELECLQDDISYSYCLADMSCEQLSLFFEDPRHEQLDGLCEVELQEASICQ